jgi:hypothetical protein
MVLIWFYEAMEDLTIGRIMGADPHVVCSLVKEYHYFQCFPGRDGEYRSLPWLSWGQLHVI